MAGTADPITTTLTGNPRIDALLWGAHWSSGGGTTVVSVHIAGGTAGEWVDDGFGTLVWALPPTAAELKALTAALTSLEAVCNLDFRTATGASGADLVWASVGSADAFGGSGWANPPGTATAHGDWQAMAALNREGYQTAGALAPGGMDYATILKLLGLTLGLDAPEDGLAVLPGLEGGTGGLGDFGLNQGIHSMMSWNDGWQTAPNGPSPSPLYGYQMGPMALDIAALQALYGVNATTRTGHDTYALPSTNAAGTGWTCIWDAGGTDRIQGAAARANTIDLRAATLEAGLGAGGFVSQAEGVWGGLTIAHGATIEEAAGGALADRITGNAAANLLLGLDGDDTLLGLDGSDSLDGGGGNDRLDGGTGNDSLLGGTGNDTLDGGLGTDTLQGGAGDDIYLLADADTLVEAASAGIDEVRAALSWTLGANFENLLLSGTALLGTGNALANGLTGNSAGNTLRGLDGNDRLDGQDGHDVLEGGAGDDTLLGGTGNDRLDGGTGLDRLEGGLGNDIYTLADGDLVIEAVAAGHDEVRASVTHTLGANLENLLLTGTLALNGTGNALGNRLQGNDAANVLRGLDGNDVLDGRGGADILDGGLGNDIYVIAAPGDTVVEGAGAGTDEVHSSVTVTLAANVEVLVLTGALACDGTGNALGNRLVGNSAVNVLRGLDGADRLEGREGADSLEGGGGDDTLRGGTGADRLSGGLGNDSFVFASPGEGGDVVLDFRNAAGDNDYMQISAAGFGGGLVAGTTCLASQFRTRADNLAQDADDRFIFRSTDQTLWHDSNGSAAGGLTLIADLQSGATLTYADLLIVA